MRLAHARPATVTLMAGSVLLTAASGVGLAVTANTAAASPASTASGESCAPLQPPTASSSPSPSPSSGSPAPAPTRTLKSSPPAAAKKAPATTTAPKATHTRALVKSPTTATPVPTRTITAKPATGKPSPTATGTGTKTATATATGTSSHNGAKTVSLTAQTTLCVQVARAQASTENGHAAQWTVSAWTTGGNVPDATLTLQAAPASGGAPGFSFGCGSADGSSSCDLGAVDAKSAPRQLQAQLTVPVTASSVKSVRLTVIASAANLTRTPEASTTVAITAPPASATTPAPATAPQNPGTQNAGPQNPGTQNAGMQNPPTQNAGAQNPAPQNQGYAPPVPAVVTTPLPVGTLPSVPAVSPSLSQGGNAAPLFPTLDPTPAGGLAQSTGKARTRPVADTLPQGATVVNAQLAGLSALALAFVLAVTRLSIRRRPGPAKGDKDPGA